MHANSVNDSGIHVHHDDHAECSRVVNRQSSNLGHVLTLKVCSQQSDLMHLFVVPLKVSLQCCR